MDAKTVGKRALAKALKAGMGRKEAVRMYKKAYLRAWNKTSGAKESLRRYRRTFKYRKSQKRYKHSVKGRETRRQYAKAPKSKLAALLRSRVPKRKEALQRRGSIRNLKTALKVKRALIKGWPDMWRIEQKIGADRVNSNQWRRAAQAKSKGISFFLYFALTHEDAVKYSEKCKIMTFEAYAKSINVFDLWLQLVEKETTV